MEAWERLLGEVESELIDVEAVLTELDDLDALRHRIEASQADGTIGQRPLLQRCAELI